MDTDAVRAFRRAGARQALTLIRRRFRGAVLPYLTGSASTAELRLVTRQVDRVLEDVEDLIA